MNEIFQIFAAVVLAILAGVFYLISLIVIVLAQPFKALYKSLAAGKPEVSVEETL